MNIDPYMLLLVGVLIAAAVGSGLVISRILCLYYVRPKNLKEKSGHAEEMRKKFGFRANSHFHPVRYCSEDRFNKFFKLFPWEASGVLAVSDSHIAFGGRNIDGGDMELEFSRFDATVTYLDRKFIRDGGLSWFRIGAMSPGDDARAHYFTCGISNPALGPMTTTTGLYEALSEEYIATHTVNMKVRD